MESRVEEEVNDFAFVENVQFVFLDKIVQSFYYIITHKIRRQKQAIELDYIVQMLFDFS